ncbi:MAG: hypothetical protein K9K64_07425 [Desulfohalobiaceae bacterium]|nr:hypothetical protein [Desulfohalobiaceae bacterium]
MDWYYKRTKPRIQEYCGRNGDHPSAWDSEFLVCSQAGDTRFSFRENQALDAILDSGADVYRSLWSRQGSLFFLDLEYKNTRDREDVYRNRIDIFRSGLEPVYGRLFGILQSFCIDFMTLMTATGYHFVFKVPFQSWVHERLAGLGSPCPQLLKQYARVHPVSHRQRPVPLECGLAFDGLGRLAEYLAKELHTDSDIPVATGVLHPRQILLDLSTYADPLHIRFIRCAGSYHQKSQQRFATMIRHFTRGPDLPLEDLLVLIAEPSEAADYIRSTPAAIPEAGSGLDRLLTAYQASGLGRRHQEFDAHHVEDEEIGQARKLLLTFSDQELAQDSGLKRAVLQGSCEGIHPRAVGLMAAERLRLATWDSPIMAWATECVDGYNPYSRALFWARLYGT